MKGVTMNIIKAIETQKAAGRKVEGIVVKVSMPNNPRARLTSFENGQAVFEEILPDNSGVEPRQWLVTNDNFELVHYELNPNSKVVPEAEFGENGLVVNGQHVDTGDIDVRAVVAVAPNTAFLQVGDLVDKYTANVVEYDVQRDKFRKREFAMPIETKTIVLPDTQDGATRAVLIANRYADVVKDPDENGDGNIVKVYEGTEYTPFLNGESTGLAVVADATAPILDAFSVEGDDSKIVFVLQSGIESVDEAKIVPEGEPKRAECYMTSFEFPTGNEYESLTVPIVATKAVSCGRHQVYTFFGGDEAYVVDTDSDIPPVTLSGDVAKAVFNHPYYCGTRTKYDEDGNIGYVYAYTDGKNEVVRFVVRHTDRAEVIELV
jgi:hypothetical protein